MKSANKGILAVGVLSLALGLNVNAQVQTETNTTTRKAAKEVQVERGEVATAAGNDLVVKMDDGSIRHFPNVPESARSARTSIAVAGLRRRYGQLQSLQGVIATIVSDVVVPPCAPFRNTGSRFSLAIVLHP